MNEKEIIIKYKKIFEFLKKIKKFENLKFELEDKKIEYEEKLFSKYYINENGFNVVFGKINCLKNKTMFYLTVSKNYINVYDEEFTF